MILFKKVGRGREAVIQMKIDSAGWETLPSHRNTILISEDRLKATLRGSDSFYYFFKDRDINTIFEDGETTPFDADSLEEFLIDSSFF